ncbi:M14 family zinc carboxypeptidase [Pseudoalteromonas luteoviolacea]|uniref:carboxypeptidase T n=1 Tax=Pseudoalteromonas luteoviolacea H33 TaxID=1365251 RepID=A0A167CV91_9GAMM|nr:M14 family zinc carboxypeptidase [Pseudoalteromonas luteoviolacea]KZN48107.1 hypothetical protein N476_22480 [Pseudoalteromonas luteoviolacea H33]KZN72275.1 hypothetical protein N477_25435 [Pseudoalteromonas luteoviolacea H33-S]MBQ4880497.1 hypothetical protein [Pseudoalteromonas luteoviolacea]MBQ4907259.1 hypothetical protein [Pseudoalteromonas luteoviolacea]
MLKKLITTSMLLALGSVTLPLHAHTSSTDSVSSSQHMYKDYSVYFANEEQRIEYARKYHGQIVDTLHNALIVSLSDKEFLSARSSGDIILEHTPPQPINRAANALVKASQNTPTPAQVSGIPNFPCYPTLEETYELAEQLAAKYPNFVELKRIGQSWKKEQGLGGHDLTVLVIKNKKRNKDKKLPTMYMQGALHAREYTAGATTIKFAQHLLENRRTNPDIKWILNQREIHILLIANPDGRKYAELGKLWRKNTNTAYCATNEEQIGADLNRNFDFGWNSTPYSSDEQCSNTYQGPVAASEPETQVIQSYINSIFEDNRGELDTDAAPLDTAGLFIDIHSHGGMIMWPWSHLRTPPPNSTGLSMLGHRLAAYNGYAAFQVGNRFHVSGSADGYAYGQLGVASFTYELGREFFEHCGNFEGEIFPNTLKSLIYAAKVAKAPYKISGGPQILDYKLEGAGNVAIPPGTPINLTAGIYDDFFGRQTYTPLPPSQAIKKVKLIIKKQGEGIVQRLKLPAADGIYDSPQEQLNYALDTSDWDDGRYTLILKAQDVTGQWGVKYAKYLTIDDDASTQNQAPVADFTPTCTYGTCQFDASKSTDDKPGLKYRWFIGSETYRQEYSGEKIEYVHEMAGTYYVTLVVEDANDISAVKHAVFDLDGKYLPIANFTYQCSNLTCEFDSSSSTDPDGQITERLWNFGVDGLYLPGNVKETFTFPVAGEYRVAFVAYDNDGLYHETFQFITVN